MKALGMKKIGASGKDRVDYHLRYLNHPNM
jgi:hypothetical protein